MAAPFRAPTPINTANPFSRYLPPPSRVFNPLSLQRRSSILALLFSSPPDRVSFIASPDLPKGPFFSSTVTLESQRRITPPARLVIGEDGGSAPQKFTPFLWNLILDVLVFIWRLPSILTGLFKKEESIVTEVEEEVDKAAEFVKVAAKAMEEAAEGAEKVAKEIEHDADTVEDLMDKVKVTTKTMHDELHEAIVTLEASVEDVEKSASQETQGKVEVKVTVKEEITETKIGSPSPPTDSPATSTSSYKSNNLMGVLPQWNPWRGIGQMIHMSSFNKRVWTVLRAFLVVFAFVLVQIHISEGLLNPQLVGRVMSSALAILA